MTVALNARPTPNRNRDNVFTPHVRFPGDVVCEKSGTLFDRYPRLLFLLMLNSRGSSIWSRGWS